MTLIYLLAIIAANLSVAHFGRPAVYLNAFLFIGLDLTARDKLHDSWRHSHLWPKMTLLIATGSLLSYALNRSAGPIAVASFAAFGLAAIADAIIYHLLRHKPGLLRINGSNLAGAAVDSTVFPTLAFGAFDPLTSAGQFAAKVAGGFFWSLFVDEETRDLLMAR